MTAMHQEKKMGRIVMDVDIVNYGDIVRAGDGHLPPDKVRRMKVSGVIDTGASYLVLPEKVAKELGLPGAGEANVRYADQRTANRAVVDQACVEMFGRRGIFTAIVEPDRSEALIGAIVLEGLDLLVDCRTQTVQPRDPNRIIAEIE